MRKREVEAVAWHWTQRKNPEPEGRGGRATSGLRGKGAGKKGGSIQS